MTDAYRLPARHVIHTVGPVWRGGDAGEDAMLASCYARSIALAEAAALASIAFPAISTGVYGFPADRAARVAVDVAISSLAGCENVNHLAFCCFSEEAARLHVAAIEGHGG